MPSENNKKLSWKKKKDRVTAVGIVLVVIALLVYFLPRETKFGYEYEQGRPWRYNSLIATFDFPIYKTQKEVEAERDSALRQFQPFYVEKPQVAEQQIAEFKADCSKGEISHMTARLFQHVSQMLNAVYQAGIVPSSDLSTMAKERTAGVRVVEGTEAVSRQLASLYSTRSAYEYIMYADTLQFPREELARCNLNKYLVPNLQPDTAKNRTAREDLLASIAPAQGMVQSGQRIIDRGEIVSAEQYKILQSFERESMRRSSPSEGMWQVVLGQTIFITCVLVIFVVYLGLFRKDYIKEFRSIRLLLCLIPIFPLVTYIMMGQKWLNVYMVPYAMVPMFIRIFMDTRTAFMAMLCSVVLSSLALHSNYEFVVVQFVAGTTAIYALRELTERSQLLRVVLLVFLTSTVIMVGYDLSQGVDLLHLDHSLYIYNAVNGVLLLFAYPLLYMIEKLSGFTSSVTLIELSNTNNKLLRRMSQVAQGTFVHSMQVANLASEVADKIGAKAQLARTGALYHDIGKMSNPAFFTENQTGVNPHDELDEERSAEIIISHVTEGEKLADKYHLPEAIKEFISTHHGRSKVKYFYIKWKNKHPGEEPDSELFTYPGPNPKTREQAIVMMCDAVEASSRSLKEYTEENIKELVDKIVDGQVQAGYFNDCPITFSDIKEAKRVLTESLKTIYHTRIAYPEEQHKPQYKQKQGHRPYFFGRKRN